MTVQTVVTLISSVNNITPWTHHELHVSLWLVQQTISAASSSDITSFWFRQIFLTISWFWLIESDIFNFEYFHWSFLMFNVSFCCMWASVALTLRRVVVPSWSLCLCTLDVSNVSLKQSHPVRCCKLWERPGSWVLVSVNVLFCLFLIKTWRPPGLHIESLCTNCSDWRTVLCRRQLQRQTSWFSDWKND